MSITRAAMVNPKFGRITKTVFKGKLPAKGFAPKNLCTKTKFTAHCEEFENYCIASFVESISVHHVGQNAFFFFKNTGINVSFGLYDFHHKYITMLLGVAIKTNTYHCTYSLVNTTLWTLSWSEYQKHPQKWSKYLPK